MTTLRIAAVGVLLAICLILGFQYWVFHPKPKPPVAVDISCHPGEDCTVTRTVQFAPPSHEAQVYAELWRVCKEKKLTCRVHYGELLDWYVASATDAQGRTWYNNDDNSPEIAARGLIPKLDGPPSIRNLAPFDTGEVKP